MKTAFIVLFLTVGVFAQTSVPKPDAKNYKDWDSYNEAVIEWKIQQSKLPKQEPKCITLQSCKAALKQEIEANKMLTEQLSAAKEENEAKGAVVTQTLEMKKKYDDAIAILDILNTQLAGKKLTDEQQKSLSNIRPGKAFDLGIEIEKAADSFITYIQKIKEQYTAEVEAYNSLVDKYNSTLQQANSIINAQNARLANQQKIYNALAIYSLAPKPQPLPLPPPPSKSMNCISNTMGNTTYTNCN